MGESKAADEHKDAGDVIRLATWNVDSIRARLDLVLDWIDRCRPDVLGLQETKVGARMFPRHPFIQRGYELLATDGGGYGGVALVSRIGLQDPVVGIPGAEPPLNEQRSISATCGRLRIHTVYGPNGRKAGSRHHAIKLAWLKLLAAWVGIDGLDGRQPTVVMGDLNVAPADNDVWDASCYRKRNLTSPAEREAFQALLDTGLEDVVRRHLGQDPLFSWWNRRGDFYDSDRGWRLDHVLADSVTATSVVGASIDRAERGRPGSSDHAPVVVDFAAE